MMRVPTHIVESFFNVQSTDDKMMQKYGSTVQLLSDFDILNKVCLTSVCCLLFFSLWFSMSSVYYLGVI